MLFNSILYIKLDNNNNNNNNKLDQIVVPFKIYTKWHNYPILNLNRIKSKAIIFNFQNIYH